MVFKRLLAFGALVTYYLVLFALLVYPVQAADTALFSATSERTSYQVGEEIQVDFSVDAGPYASTLSTIDMDVKVSDMSVIKPKDSQNPFVAGTIYPSTFNQSVENDLLTGVFHVNPENKPANRSGLIATVSFTALKAGSATISYDRIEAAEEKNETEFISTSASSLVINIGGSGTSAQTDSDSSATSYVQVTPVYSGYGDVSDTAGETATGPEQVFALAVLGGGLTFGIWRLLSKRKGTI
ncbi:MAG: hypothetical protein OEV37_02910 [Candidatus Berkelbacteria bacterium]|nr:hypothetical protein [Candidatus Berkelbacteria bacterium]